MEGCISTEKDVDKLLAKFESYKKSSGQNLDQIHEQISKIRQDVAQCDTEMSLATSHQSLTVQLGKKLKTTSQKLSGQHKDLHSSVSRIGKTIDRNFDSDCGSMNMHEMLIDETHHRHLNTAICEHFYRQGSLEVAESLAHEASLEINTNFRQPFIEMNEILQSLRKKCIDPALDWALRNKERLQHEKSNLEFKLHRLKFIELLKQGPSSQCEALQYAKNFQKFSPEHSSEIQQLMGCFLYLKQGLAGSPYASILSDTVWDDIDSTFSQEACKLMGMSIDSPLMVSFSSGCQALPALIAIKSVIEQRQISGLLSSNDELPIDIDALEGSQQYHSVFACPILRQQTTLKNPPLRLVCGHVISRDALNKLVSGSKVKCPYCPVEQSPNDAREVHF
ncbi:E3 ubiquitin-protein ligase RMND5A-like [Clavelina lepadiformis]